MCFSEHIAPVLSLTPALNNSVIVSGGEDSRIIITSLMTGDVVMKIDHHRGPVMSVKVNTAGDVLVSGPADILVLLSFSFFRTFRLSNSVELFYFLLFLASLTLILV
jgi:WD40 repeat protein